MGGDGCFPVGCVYDAAIRYAIRVEVGAIRHDGKENFQVVRCRRC